MSLTRKRAFAVKFWHASVRQIPKVSLLLSLLGVIGQVSVQAAEVPTVIPAPTFDAPASNVLQTAVLAGGCFWGVQAVFQHVKGVTQVLSGYSGGTKEMAQYEIVSSGQTGHAESVQIKFDPRQVSYGKILQIFFSVAHNPTELNRQGPDTGPQYRSVIFYQDATQRGIAERYIAELDRAGIFNRPIVTRLDPLSAFYPAETYHQDYAVRHPNQPYIAINDLPKVDNLKKLFPDVYRDTPVTVSDNRT
jgi:peptide-methionine (S)-S-oxide reductase